MQGAKNVSPSSTQKKVSILTIYDHHEDGTNSRNSVPWGPLVNLPVSLFFSYPSERIKSRYDYLRRVKGVPTQFLAVDQIMSFGDKDFATRVVGDTDEGQSFLLFCDDRKKAHKAATAEKKRKPRRTRRPATANEVPIESSQR